MAEQTLPEYQLKPQAEPTNQYAHPEVRMPPGYVQGKQLSQVAEALRGFSQDIGQIADRRYEAWRQGTERQADQYYQNHQAVLQNQNDLKGAVERGELPQHANPWLQVRLTQDIARNQASTAQAAIYNDLRKSDIFHKDDPQAVSNFVNDRFGKLAQEQNAWGIAAMQPIVQQAHAQIMSRWADERGQERMNEAHTATGAAVESTVKNILGDHPANSPEGSALMPQVIDSIQTHYNQLTQVVDKATASKWISDAAFEIGKQLRSADLTRGILDGVTGQDGIKLSKLAENAANLTTLPREITELQVMDNQVQESLYQTRVKKDFHTLMSTAQDWAKKNGSTNFWDYKASFEDMKDKLPEAWDEYQKTMAAASAQNLQFQNDQWTREGEPLNDKLWTKTLSPGGIDPKEQSDLLTQLIHLGTFGRESAKLYDYFVKSHSMGTFIWGDTNPQQMVELVDRANQADKSPLEFRQYLLGLAAAKKISKTDFDWALDTHHKMTAGVGAGALNYNREIQNLSAQIEGSFTDPNNPNSLSHKDLEGDPKYWQSIAGATRELQDGLVKLEGRDDFKAMTPDQQLSKVNQLVDEVSTHHGGWTAKQLIESSRKGGSPLEELNLTGPNASKPLEQAKPVEPGKAPEAAPKSGQEVLDKADPASKSLEPYQRNALGAYLKDSIFNTATFGREDYNAHVQRIYSDALLGGEASANFATNARLNSGVGAVEKLAWIRGNYPDWTKVKDYQEGVSYGPKDTFRSVLGNEKTEIEQANLARARLKDLTPVAQVARRELDTILSDPNQPRPGTGQWLTKRDRVLELSNYVEEYSTLRKLVGFTPDEVKTAGSDAWKSMPIFVNAVEIKEHGEEVAAKLGIKDAKGKADFIAHQITLTNLMRQTPVGQ